MQTDAGDRVLVVLSDVGSGVTITLDLGGGVTVDVDGGDCEWVEWVYSGAQWDVLAIQGTLKAPANVEADAIYTAVGGTAISLDVGDAQEGRLWQFIVTGASNAAPVTLTVNSMSLEMQTDGYYAFRYAAGAVTMVEGFDLKLSLAPPAISTLAAGSDYSFVVPAGGGSVRVPNDTEGSTFSLTYSSGTFDDSNSITVYATDGTTVLHTLNGLPPGISLPSTARYVFRNLRTNGGLSWLLSVEELFS